MLEVFFSIIIFLIGFMIIEVVRIKLKIKFLISFFLYLWHTLFCIIYSIYVLTYSGDALSYYKYAYEEEIVFGIGTSFVNFLTSILFLLYNLSFFEMALIFNIFGSIGLILFYASLNSIKQNNFSIIFITFLPSISFWSSGIGKDSIAFLSVSLLLWSIINIKGRIFLFFIAILVMFLVRPHISLVMLISYVFIYLIYTKTNLFKIIYLILIIICTIFLFDNVLDYISIESIFEIINFIKDRQVQNLDGGSSINIMELNFIEKIFTFLFRPFIFEISYSITFFAVAFDNFILLILFISFMFKYIINKFKIKMNFKFAYLYTYSILVTVILSLTISNLGISVRQKWIVLPVLIYIWFYYIYGVKNEKEIN